MKITLITYGDDKYKIQRDFLKQTALASGFFDIVKVFTPADLEQSFKDQYKDILSVSKGGGYWIWKPLIVKKTLDELTDGDILIFCDAGCLINKNGRQRFDEYIHILLDSTNGMIAFELPHKEVEYTKQEIFNFFNADHMKDYNQTMATVILLKKCPHAQQLIDLWYKTLNEFSLAFTDELDSHLQDSRFIDSRHDQSVLSVIRRIHGAEFIPDETYFLDFVREGQPYPFWAARLRG